MIISEIKDKIVEDFAIKIIVVGDSGVGKSNFISRLLGNSFKANSLSTIGVEQYTKCYRVTESNNSKIIKVHLWDTAGQERYKSLTSSYYKGSNGVFILYDPTKEETFINIDEWMKDVVDYCKSNVSVMLVGTKSDLFNLSVIDSTILECKAQEYSKHNKYKDHRFIIY